MQIVKFH